MAYRIGADLVVVVHFAFLLFVVLGGAVALRRIDLERRESRSLMKGAPPKSSRGAERGQAHVGWLQIPECVARFSTHRHLEVGTGVEGGALDREPLDELLGFDARRRL